jgi:NAD-dependent dihydropyrimidine dehydrogenase PreA subunit
MTLRNIPREQIPWYPRIDLDKCVGCQECFNFCRNGVYLWDEDKSQPIVANPYNCVVGCSACANLCTGEAISFPTKEEIRQVIAALQSA